MPVRGRGFMGVTLAEPGGGGPTFIRCPTGPGRPGSGPKYGPEVQPGLPSTYPGLRPPAGPSANERVNTGSPGRTAEGNPDRNDPRKSWLRTVPLRLVGGAAAALLVGSALGFSA